MKGEPNSASDGMHGDNLVKDLPSQMGSIICASGDTRVVSKYRSSGLKKVIRAPSMKAANHCKGQRQSAVAEEILILVRGNEGPEPERNSQECCMCGDIGLRKDLFRCCKCQHRLQHTYCSNWYPKKRSYAGICNWCDTEDRQRRKQMKQTHPQSCVSNENHIHTSKVDKSGTNHGKRCSKDQQTDAGKPRNPWRNELEMLLDAAALTEVGLEKERGGGRQSVNEVADHDKQGHAGEADAKTSKTLSRTDDTKQDVNIDQGITVSNCKDQPSSLSKKIARRYKSVLDVY